MNKREALYKILCEKDVVKSIANNFLTLEKIIPEITLMIGFEHKHPNHNLDVWGHTLKALSISKNKFEIRLALLLHDIGKPLCFQDGLDKRRFWNHPAMSEKLSRKILTRLGFNGNYLEELCYLIRYHDDPIKKEDIKKNYKLEKMRFEIQLCDGYAHSKPGIERRKTYNEETAKMFETFEQNL